MKKSPESTPSVDDKMRECVITQLDREPSITAPGIGVSVEDGVVTLSGHVESYSQKVAAAEAAMRVPGVRALAQEIDFRSPKSLANTDDKIARAVLEVIEWDVKVPSHWIKPVVDHGLVTLKGEVDWEYQRKTAEESVRRVSGVTDVYNHITLKSRPHADELKGRIEATLQRNAPIAASSIRMTVQNDHVALQGSLGSTGERAVVEHAARSAPGVKAVENASKSTNGPAQLLSTTRLANWR
jgi:osmotically-inducible protein OsmY